MKGLSMSTNMNTDSAGRRGEVASTGCPVLHHRTAPEHNTGGGARLAGLAYGAFCYVVFLATFGYAMGFVSDVGVPRSIDRAVDAPLAQAVAVDLGLLTVFAVQHSVMARPGFKRWWTRYVPTSIERSTYVLLASAALALLFWQWRSIDAVVWNVGPAPVRIALSALGWAGWGIVLASTFMIDHFELFGLRQVVTRWRSKPHAEAGFRTVLLYRLVRHPLMLGFLIAFWATPTMTAGHLLFAAVTTSYILIALQLEERDLVNALGETYRRYRQQVPMLIPRPWR
jgi:methanethiol S-methyltransferase